jgi:hypothetical protein
VVGRRAHRPHTPRSPASVDAAEQGGEVSVGGDYLGIIFFGLLVFGPGVGLAFVTASIAALAGVDEHEAGLSSGLSNTAFQVGAALGVAILSTVAVSRTEELLTANPGSNPLVALTEGFQSAFFSLAILGGIGAALALVLLGRPRRAEQERLEPAPAPDLWEGTGVTLRYVFRLISVVLADNRVRFLPHE